ncbi:hypothetical protein AAMO2058_000378700 [Amorphochlora amoebiformis]
MSPLGIALTFAALASAQSDSCRSKHNDQHSCDEDTACTWCEAGAVPSACFEKRNAKKLPSGVFKCDSSSGEESAASDVYSFVSIGDWGGALTVGKDYIAKKNTYAVAKAMAATAEELDAKFIINTGDNFYWCGIQNTSDFQIAGDWLKPYNHPSLDIPWYGVLGNHEYGYNVQAQLDMTKKYKNWVIDDRYYTKRIQVSSGVYMTMVFLDTSPCVSEYRSESRSGWDPCGSEYPTCSLNSDPTDQFEGPCLFHQNILTQDCSSQKDWLLKTMAAIPTDDWKIVVGHHPLDECDVEDFVKVIQSSGVDLYLNGHAHTLTHYTIDHKGAYITTGAGSLVNTDDQKGGTPARDLTLNKVLGKAGFQTSHKHSYETVWNQVISGFTAHSFNKDFTKLTTNFIDYTGNEIYSFTVSKGASPSPSPSPTPSGGCCYYRDEDCQAGQVCCKSECQAANPESCSYTQWGCNSRFGQKHRCQWSNHNVCLVGSARSEEL